MPGRSFSPITDHLITMLIRGNKIRGATTLTYYGSFDDKAFKGKIKNIDRSLFTYYSSYEERIQWNIKNRSRISFSGNVKYYIKIDNKSTFSRY